MTIDERIEALVQALEPVAGMQIDLQKKMDQTSQQINALTLATQENSQHIHALVRIVEIHEQRLSGLEGSTE